MFSDVIFCKDCGKKLLYYENRKGYVCGTHAKLGNTVCKSHLIKEYKLVEVIQEDLQEYAKAFSEDQEIIKRLEKKLASKAKRVNVKVKSNENKIDKLKKAKGNLTKKYAMGEILNEDYQLAMERMNKDIVRLEEELVKAKGLITKEEIVENTRLVKNQLMKFVNFDEITREVANCFIEKIVVSENGDLEIFYRFNIC